MHILVFFRKLTSKLYKDRPSKNCNVISKNNNKKITPIQQVEDQYCQ